MSAGFDFATTSVKYKAARWKSFIERFLRFPVILLHSVIQYVSSVSCHITNHLVQEQGKQMLYRHDMQKVSAYLRATFLSVSNKFLNSREQHLLEVCSIQKL